MITSKVTPQTTPAEAMRQHECQSSDFLGGLECVKNSDFKYFLAKAIESPEKVMTFFSRIILVKGEDIADEEKVGKLFSSAMTFGFIPTVNLSPETNKYLDLDVDKEKGKGKEVVETVNKEINRVGYQLKGVLEELNNIFV